jgi:outer membrane lipoprotein-sorting protein
MKSHLIAKSAALVLISLPLMLGGCASTKAVDEAKAAAAKAQSTADEALATAKAADEKATAANEKADRMFHKSLKK